MTYSEALDKMIEEYEMKIEAAYSEVLNKMIEEHEMKIEAAYNIIKHIMDDNNCYDWDAILNDEDEHIIFG